MDGRSALARCCSLSRLSLLSRLCLSCSNASRRYVDYLFPDESGSMASLKILEAARAWKKQKASEEGSQ